ncbi:MAG: RNA 2',3'-cyclic phosphodiesterase [Terriglobales bacterium]|jgi:2'-5' RNA ligase
MRLFIALDIDDGVRERITRFLEGVHGFAPEARWVRPESLHVTLKFIGEKPEEAVEEIQHALSEVKAGGLPMTFRGYGFFPGAKAARVFWVGIEAGPQLASLASLVDGAMAGLGIPKEDHAFSAHLTLARGGGGSGAPKREKSDRSDQRFARLQEKLAAMSTPEFGTMTAREFCLYKSHPSPGGSRYTKIARFALL